MATTITVHPIHKVEEPAWFADFVKLFTGICSIVGAIYGGVKWAWPRWKEHRQARKVVGGFIQMAEAMQKNHDILSGLVHRNSRIANRAIIFRGHNGGGQPSSKTPFHTSASMWESDRDDNFRAIATYQSLCVDWPYCQMLLEVIEKKLAVMEVKTMPAGLLRDIYHREKVYHAALAFIGIQGNEIIYISVARLLNEPFSNDDITQLKLAANEIKNNLGIK